MKKSLLFDPAQFPPELRLLLLLLKRCDDDVSLARRPEWTKDVNWSHFLSLARHHRVYPSLYTKLYKSGIIWFPPQVLQNLHQDYQNNTFRMLQLGGEMEHVTREFSTVNIQTLILKGPVLGDDLYGDISLRASGDIDMLIPMDRLKQGEKLLVKLGYIKDGYIRTILNDWKWRHHHAAFFHPHKGIKLELHWRLNPGPGKEPGFHDLWVRKRVSPLTGYPVHILGREDLFLFLACHGARHGWSRLQWLLDIDRMMTQQMDWDKLRFLLHKYRCVHLGGQALTLAGWLLDTPFLEQSKPVVRGKRPIRLAQDALFYIKQMVNLHTDPVPEDVALYHKRHLFSLMPLQQKLLFLLSLLHPYPKDIEVLKLPEMLHFLYFPLRPLLWVWRKVSIHNNGG